MSLKVSSDSSTSEGSPKPPVGSRYIQRSILNKKLLETSASLVVTSALLVVTTFASNLIANIVTTSKALVTTSDALVPSSVLPPLAPSWVLLVHLSSEPQVSSVDFASTALLEDGVFPWPGGHFRSIEQGSAQ